MTRRLQSCSTRAGPLLHNFAPTQPNSDILALATGFVFPSAVCNFLSCLRARKTLLNPSTLLCRNYGVVNPACSTPMVFAMCCDLPKEDVGRPEREIGNAFGGTVLCMQCCLYASR